MPAEADTPPARAAAPQRSVPRFFPSPEKSAPEGLIGIGGVLDPEWLLDAYRHGIFPWPDADYEPMLWWSPDPRAIIELDGLHVSRRLQRTLRSGRFRATFNQDFSAVITGCATAPDRQGGTWLTADMIAAYERLHALGHAHSVEVWHGADLAGGVYGVAIGGLFAAESMFHTVTDASKVAVVHLVQRLRERGYRLLDIQQWTGHTGRMGATEIPRADYLQRLAGVVDLPVAFQDAVHQP